MSPRFVVGACSPAAARNRLDFLTTALVGRAGCVSLCYERSVLPFLVVCWSWRTIACIRVGNPPAVPTVILDRAYIELRVLERRVVVVRLREESSVTGGLWNVK